MTDREELEEVAKMAADHTIIGIRSTVTEAVDTGIENAMTRMGLDVSAPLETQADMMFLRVTRKAASGVKSRILLTSVGLVVAGAIALLLAQLGNFFEA